MAIVVFLYVIIDIALVNTVSIEFIFSSAPTVVSVDGRPLAYFPKWGILRPGVPKKFLSLNSLRQTTNVLL